MKLAILITNPNHHLELSLGVAKIAKAAGDEVKYISLCELRRMQSPVDTFMEEGLDFIKFSDLPQQLKPSSGKKSLGKSDSKLRILVQTAFWLLKLRPFIKSAFRGADKVLLMNDGAFPGNKICAWLKKKKIPFYLLQEGIRFPLPNQSEGKYGGAGAEKVLTWGKRSANHFREIVADHTRVVVAGSPRFDNFLRQVEEAAVIPNETRRLGIFTNPIDDLGFCSKDEKLKIFEHFIRRSADYLNSNEIVVSIKCHPREDVDEYMEIGTRYLNHIMKSPTNIFDAIMEVEAGVIMASTVGLELMGAGKCVAQLEIPGYGYVFDYTDDERVIKVPAEGDFELVSLFEDMVDLTYFHEHVAKGRSSEKVYKHIKG
ncbi:MAG: hypothetical protein HEP71_28705 [Roseivirga sp.]|nr:hypothetical protein [Roseivirga sp.]